MERIEQKIEKITPLMAKEYLKRNIFNRKKSERVINVYAKDMKEGRWQLNGDSIRFSKDGHLLDGQHRLEACIVADVPFLTNVIRGLDCDTFKTIDNGKGRTASDVFCIDRIQNFTNAAAVVRRYLLLISNNTNADVKMGNCLIREEYEKEKDMFQKSINFAKRCYKKHNFLEVSYIASIYCYLVLQKHHPEDVVESFFSQLFDIKTSEVHSIQDCRSILVKDKYSNRRMVGKSRLGYVIKTWNNYLLKKNVKLQYVPDRDKDIWFY